MMALISRLLVCSKKPYSGYHGLSPLHASAHAPLLPSLVSTRNNTPFLALSAASSSPAGRTTVELNKGIAQFYDSSSSVWEDMWGEHMHHGFYDPDLPLTAALTADHTAAQIRMIEESLSWAGIPDQGVSKPQRIIDVGCGIGGSSRYLSRKYGAHVVGITLSPIQAKRASEITSSAGLSDKVNFQVADALNQPFPDEEFDFVWSMESGEHMPNKEKFMAELVRVTKPGGHILIVTWCHRELSPGEESLKASEQDILDKICDSYYLPAWCAASKYVNIAESMALQDIKSADWSKHITPFWPAVIASAFSVKGLFGLVKSGWTTVKGAIAMAYMVQGYNSGVIKFALITARKG